MLNSKQTKKYPDQFVYVPKNVPKGTSKPKKKVGEKMLGKAMKKMTKC